MVTAERRGQRRALLRFAVHDTGVGISKGAQEAIFHPFTQADTSTTRRFGGTGLGLSICRQLADLMGGTLSIESTEREGSCFEFAVMLPVGRWEHTGDPVNDDHGDDIACENLLDSALRLLLVEDNIINQEVALGLLASKGWHIDVANNGVEGVDAVETANADGTPYDAILMDCQMPRMDGYEATGLIRRMEGERRHPGYRAHRSRHEGRS